MPTASRSIRISPGVTLGGAGRLFLIAGPCVIESRAHTLSLARRIKSVAAGLGLPFVFKASFDKANRSSGRSYRGPGLEAGLDILAEVKKTLDVPVLSDVHETAQVEAAARVLDILQVPAFLCRQTDLILAVAATGKPVNVKKGQFLSPEDMGNVVEKLESEGSRRILLTERGTTFGYNNLVVDFRSIPILQAFGHPVVIDASHSVQRPGGRGTSSGGDRCFIPLIARAGVAAGADGLFLEVHDDPSSALSDADNALPLSALKPLLAGLVRIRRAMGNPRRRDR
jgi:2-dehydro-3-deoxyphosphooctonate aldolase (KDO 8-P synthase)